MALIDSPVVVRLPKNKVSFPSVCPHCLRETTNFVPITSNRSLAGYYVIYTKWRHSVIQVPCCDKLTKIHKCWDSASRGIIVVFIFGGIFAGAFKINNTQCITFLVVAVGVFAAAYWLTRPENYIRILDSEDGKISFGVENKQYADLLAEINGGTVEEWTESF